MLSFQPFEPFAIAAVLADAVTTYMGLRSGGDERNPLLRVLARFGGLRLPWAPGLAMAAITVWQHRFNWANFVSDDRQQLGWMVTAAIHAGATLLNARSLSKG